MVSVEAQERWRPTVLWKLPALQVIQVGRTIEAMVIPVAGDYESLGRESLIVGRRKGTNLQGRQLDQWNIRLSASWCIYSMGDLESRGNCERSVCMCQYFL